LYVAPVTDERGPQTDTIRQVLLLGPGMALTTLGLISLFRDAGTALTWVVLAAGLLLMVAYGRSRLLSRPR
jgi:cell division protein FtsW (lipid II flippase)